MTSEPSVRDATIEAFAPRVSTVASVERGAGGEGKKRACNMSGWATIAARTRETEMQATGLQQHTPSFGEYLVLATTVAARCSNAQQQENDCAAVPKAQRNPRCPLTVWQNARSSRFITCARHHKRGPKRSAYHKWRCNVCQLCPAAASPSGTGAAPTAKANAGLGGLLEGFSH